jgi:hypothetical protein
METIRNEKLELLEKEVIQTHNKICEAYEKNDKLKEIYKGCQIYLSPCTTNPDFLILGYNPGDGYYKKHKERVKRFEPMSKHDFFYNPWKQIKQCFTKIGKEKLLDNAVVTNYYFFSTENTEKLGKFFKLLPKELKELSKKSDEWIKTIITEISPKYMLCVGFQLKPIIKKNLLLKYKCVESGKNASVATINNITTFFFHRRRNKKELQNYLIKYIN